MTPSEFEWLYGEVDKAVEVLVKRILKERFSVKIDDMSEEELREVAGKILHGIHTSIINEEEAAEVDMKAVVNPAIKKAFLEDDALPLLKYEDLFGDGLSLSDALDAVIAGGEQWRRSSWKEGEHLALAVLEVEHMKTKQMIIKVSGSSFERYSPSDDDMFAEDWLPLMG